MSRIIVGTAGHIDHGKSSLVRALTGTDPDRLPEEQKRGITIDLGFAFLDDVAAIIDVPGHEKFIRNMVAGASTVDFAILVVAADDGVMPQTTEHLQILRLLGVRRGCVVVTKLSMVEPEWLELVVDQVQKATRRTFLEDGEIFRVDSLRGDGIREFRAWLVSTLSAIEPRADRGLYRQPVDRVFTVKGRGTVITGTVISGALTRETAVRAYPGDALFRVKHIESHASEVEQVRPGQRAALNLLGDTDQLERGVTIGPPTGLLASTRVLVRIEQLESVEPLRDRQRIRVLTGTQEVIGRVQLLATDSGFAVANLLLEEPIVAAWRDHFIVRRYSPLETLGGGIVLDPQPPAFHVKRLALELSAARALAAESIDAAIAAYVAARADFGLALDHLAAAFAVPLAWLGTRIQSPPLSDQIVKLNAVLFRTGRLLEIESAIVERLKSLFSSSAGQVGFAPASLRDRALRDLPDPALDSIIVRLVERSRLAREGGLLRFPERKIALTPDQQRLMDRLNPVLHAAGFTPPSSELLAEQIAAPQADVARALVLMERLGKCRRLGVDMFFDAERFAEAVDAVQRGLRDARELSVADVSKLLSSSRKYVVPLLEYLDERGITQRNGNVRVAGRNAAVAQSKV
ncbi:selenocysteine-specific translation elongation factor [candidate division KSB1 bacterium]|nr:selenocysteine-specific translation elongation factor [candidate division KSB1 bacterium]